MEIFVYATEKNGWPGLWRQTIFRRKVSFPSGDDKMVKQYPSRNAGMHQTLSRSMYPLRSSNPG